MIGPFNWLDLLFIVTIVLLVFNGMRNGAVFSLVHLIAIPIAFGVAYFFGKQFTLFLASNGLSFSPLVSYLVLFFGTILVLHIIGTALRGVVSAIPVVGLGNSLIGGVIDTAFRLQFTQGARFPVSILQFNNIKPGVIPTIKQSITASLQESMALLSRSYQLCHSLLGDK